MLLPFMDMQAYAIMTGEAQPIMADNGQVKFTMAQ